MLINGEVIKGYNPSRILDIKSIAEKKISNNKNVIFSVQTHPRTKYQIYLKVLDKLKEAKASKISIANPPAF